MSQEPWQPLLQFQTRLSAEIESMRAVTSSAGGALEVVFFDAEDGREVFRQELSLWDDDTGERIRRPGIRITRLARGIPVGSGLEYVDGTTIGEALAGRQEM